MGLVTVHEITNDLPCTFAQWTTSTLATPLGVPGPPTLNLNVDAPTAVATQWAGAEGQLVLSPKWRTSPPTARPP
jgi:hypothetical protein